MIQEHNIDLPPGFLILAGLAFDLIGAILLGISALGSRELLAALQREDFHAERTQIGVAVTVSKILIFVFVWLVCFMLFRLLVPQTNLVFDILVGSMGILLWRVVMWVTSTVAKGIERLGPGSHLRRRKAHRPGCAVEFIRLLWALTWAVVYGVVRFVDIAVQFWDLPLQFLSERLVVPRLALPAYRYVDSRLRVDESWRFNRHALYGILWLVAGFALQIVGVLLVLLER